MLKSRVVEEDGLIVTHFGGRHTPDDATASLEELVSLNEGRSEIYEIVINDDDLESVFSKDEMEALQPKVVSVFGRFDSGGLAVVASTDYVFGLTRMLTATIHNERIAVAVFRTEKLAREWIQEIRGLHRS